MYCGYATMIYCRHACLPLIYDIPLTTAKWLTLVAATRRHFPANRSFSRCDDSNVASASATHRRVLWAAMLIAWCSRWRRCAAVAAEMKLIFDFGQPRGIGGTARRNLMVIIAAVRNSSSPSSRDQMEDFVMIDS